MHRPARRCSAPGPWGGFALCLVMLASAGCKEGYDRDPAKEGYALSDTTSTGQTIGKLKQRCELNETVTDPAENTPEWTARELLTAARSPVDDRAAFDRFFAQFQGQREDWVRSQYWPRAVEHNALFVPEGDKVTFGICRRETLADGKVKLYIRSSEESKKHVPITFEQLEDGTWKVTNYSP
ncbi:MAG: hypothetical protein H6744_21565 [Deltaproteobacteria bacterium]|nr:hypothetical protein [Deltaproteobacteria bacterium]